MTPGAERTSVVGLGPWWAFMACWVASAVLLYLAGTPPAGPAVFPDEVCRLGWARLLSGTGSHFEMSPSSYCDPYYPLLLAPVFSISDDPAGIHRGVFALNTVFAAACLPLAVRLGLYHFGLNLGASWLAGFAVLAYPALTLYSYHAMPETMLFAGVLLAFALWCRWIEKPNWTRYAVLLGMAFLLFAMHRKMLAVPVVLIGGAVAGYWLVRTPEYRLKMLLAGLGMSAAFLLDWWIKNSVGAPHFHGGDGGAVEVIGRLSSLDQIRASIGISAGVLVYSSLVTGGLIWLLIATGLDSILKIIRHGYGSIDAFSQKSLFPFCLLGALIGVTAAFFSGGSRVDIWFYGRHVEAALAVALIPCIAIIVRGRLNSLSWPWVVAPAMLVLLALIAFNPGPPWEDFSRIHVIGAGFLMDWIFQADKRWMMLAYCAIILALSGVMLLSRLPRLLRFSALLPFVLVTASTHVTTGPFEGVPLERAVPASAAEVLRAADPCHIVFDARNHGRLRRHQYFRLQYHFPHCSIELGSAATSAPAGALMVMVRSSVDCESKVQCHDLHPDLVLFRAEAQVPFSY